MKLYIYRDVTVSFLPHRRGGWIVIAEDRAAAEKLLADAAEACARQRRLDDEKGLKHWEREAWSHLIERRLRSPIKAHVSHQPVVVPEELRSRTDVTEIDVGDYPCVEIRQDVPRR